MSIDETIDWLMAVHCQWGNKPVFLDGKDMFVKEIVEEAATQLDRLRSEITWYFGK